MEIFATALKLNHTVADLDLQHQAFLERVVHRRRVHHRSGGYLVYDWSSHSESEDEVVIHRHRSLGVAGIRAVSDMLTTNVALMTLNLDGNHVGYRCCGNRRGLAGQWHGDAPQSGTE